MGKLMALDYGTRRVGIAVSDMLHLFAFPVKSVRTHEVLPFLKNYIQKEPVETFVIGWPLELTGEEGAMTRLVSQFIRLLNRHFPHISTVSYDERFTSVMARKSLVQGGVKKKQRAEKGALDAVSASFILHSYIETKRSWDKDALNKQQENLVTQP